MIRHVIGSVIWYLEQFLYTILAAVWYKFTMKSLQIVQNSKAYSIKHKEPTKLKVPAKFQIITHTT